MTSVPARAGENAAVEAADVVLTEGPDGFAEFVVDMTLGAWRRHLAQADAEVAARLARDSS